MNSTVLMEKSDCSEFFYDKFEPGVHYIPVQEDLSDLPKQLSATISNQAQAREMAAQWVSVGQSLLSLECILDYIDNLLRGYAKLQRFVPRLHESWPLHHLNSTAHYFLQSEPPSIATCSPHF